METTKSLVLNNDKDSVQYFIDAMESKDPYTQGHSHHVNAVVIAIFNSLPVYYQKRLDEKKLFTAALLHDIGKIMTPDDILNKDGALSEREWAIMKEHAENSKKLVENTSFSYMGDWLLYHHERIDDKGYYRLGGDEIPLESKIIAIADTFSALRTYRIYRPACGIEKTIKIMRENSGTQLDAELLEYFLCIDVDILEALECNCEICRQRRKKLEARLSGLA